MQYGTLNSSQRAMFDTKQVSFIRKPTFVVWIEGFGDTTEYVMGIDSEIGLESLRGRGSLNIGRAILELNNENGYFYSRSAVQRGSKVKKYARIKIWAGFDYLNIPIFTGVVDNVKPIGTLNAVTINCRDYIGLFFDSIIKDELGLNNTPKSILEYLCSKVGVLANIIGTEEFTTAYDELKFKGQKMMSVIEKICDSIFCVAYFDEEGTLRLVEREFSAHVPPCNGRMSQGSDWRFDDSNIVDCMLLADSEIINDVTVEYRSGFFSRCLDQSSIDEYRAKARQLGILSLSSDLTSSQTQGTIQELLDHDLEGFKFTTSNSSSVIDSVYVRMKKSDAHGYVCVKIYTNNGGVPGSLVGTSSLKASDNLTNEFSWEIFCFDTPIRIYPLTDYWCIIDTDSVVSGTVSVQITNASINGKHTYYDSSSWHIENNKYVLHIIRGSNQAYRVAEDVVRFYKKPYERVKIVAPAVPQLQLTDEVRVNIKKMGLAGRYVIERRKHVLTSETYTTIDTLRKVG
ncbi:MAG: hypothetical protein QG588_508 [Candidatus Poribacteria bacterium]|nr:hypothetical protein [Candidatus Poribacteria bacterium]